MGVVGVPISVGVIWEGLPEELTFELRPGGRRSGPGKTWGGGLRRGDPRAKVCRWDKVCNSPEAGRLQGHEPGTGWQRQASGSASAPSPSSALRNGVPLWAGPERGAGGLIPCEGGDTQAPHPIAMPEKDLSLVTDAQLSRACCRSDTWAPWQEHPTCSCSGSPSDELHACASSFVPATENSMRGSCHPHPAQAWRTVGAQLGQGSGMSAGEGGTSERP